MPLLLLMLVFIIEIGISSRSTITIMSTRWLNRRFRRWDNCPTAALVTGIIAINAKNFTQALLDFSMHHDSVRLFFHQFEPETFVEA